MIDGEKRGPLPQTEQFQEQFKWEVDHSQLIECFVENGFVIVDSLLDPKLISNLFRTVSSRYEELKGNFLSSNPNSNFSSVSIGICRKIVSEIECSFGKSEDVGKTERGKGLKHIVRAERSGITLRYVLS